MSQRADDTSKDVNGDGIPDECCVSSQPTTGFYAKNRYLSIDAGDAGENQAIRVTFRFAAAV